MGWMTGVQFPTGVENFFLAPTSRLALGPTQTPIEWVLGIKQPAYGADPSPPSSAEVKNAWSCTSTPQYVMAWCLVKHRDNLIFTFTALLK
jgi:hypothetical protein